MLFIFYRPAAAAVGTVTAALQGFPASFVLYHFVYHQPYNTDQHCCSNECSHKNTISFLCL